jgi:hypothetical protein
MYISFNLRLRYDEAVDCVKKITELGGEGAITVGGSWYSGTEKQIDVLLVYMGEQGYDTESMAVNEMPYDASQRWAKSMLGKH